MSPTDLRFTDLRDFLQLLEQRGELQRITEPVAIHLEMAAIADRTVKEGGPALLFEHPVDAHGQRLDMPVAMNLYGTRQRMAWALGVADLDDIGERLRSLLDVKLGGGLLGLMSNLPKLREVASLPPKRVRTAPVQQVVWRGDEVDLSRIPVLTTWPQDGGPFLTLPLVVTKDPIEGDLNIGMYRMQVLGRNVTAMHWQRHKTGARHFENAREAGQRLEVAVALGGDPALTYAATAPLPPIPGLNEYSLTGFLRGRSLELVKGVTVDLEVPAHAEIVLEGYVDPAEELVVEGPFGDHTGFYTLPDLYPAFHVTAVTMREAPIYPATVVGKPPMEDAYLIEASERIFLVPAQVILPEVLDYHLPPAGIAHNLVNVRIDKRYPGQAYKVANGLLGLGQMMFAKVILVSDDPDVPVNDHRAFWRAVLAKAVPGRDSQVAKGPIDVLDHSSRTFGFGSKLILDGTTKHPEEGGEVAWQPNPERVASELPSHAEVLDQHQHAGGFWFITTRKERAGQGRHLGEWAARQAAAKGTRLIAVLDHQTDPRDFEDAIWTLLNNIDPERDVQVVDDTFGSGPVFVVDGTPKLESEGFTRGWPEKLEMDPQVAERVEERWPRLFSRAEEPVG
ncbi:MAG: menaquinone biosynthesis decarboxylase [Deinococcales bacterium]|nr:menaquinone biosynthesis decarboxylase [Deinococcales bacterium]